MKANGSNIEIQLPVLTYSLSSASDSAVAYQILCNWIMADGVMASY